MEKQTKQFDVEFDFDWTYGIEISKLRADLDELEKLGATHIDIEASVFYDCAKLTIEAKRERLETDEEFEKRINAIKQREALAKQRELNELNELNRLNTKIMIEVITGVSAKDLKYKFDRFQANNYEEPISQDSGGKRKIIDKADCTNNGTDFIMTVAYHWEKIAARY